jgi:hypothetical protein
MSDNPFPVSNASGTVVSFGTQLDSAGNTVGMAALAVVNGGTAQAVTDLNPVPTTPGRGTVVPAPALATQIVSAGVAVEVLAGPVAGGYVTNPATAAAQGLGSTENLYVDPVNSPGGSDATANGTTTLLTPGSTYTVPPLAAGQQLRANATSAGHKFTAVAW